MLKMHRIAYRAVPIAAPDKTGPLEYIDQIKVHIAGRTRHIGFGIDIDCDSPGVRGQSAAVSLLAELKTSAKRFNLSA